MREVPEQKLKSSFGDKVDRALGVIAPRMAARRRQARLLMDAQDFVRAQLRGGYRGARRDRPYSNWMPGGGSPDADILADLPRLRERSRDLNRNNPYAAGATDTIVVNTTGSGIRHQAAIDRKRLDLSEDAAKVIEDDAEAIWSRWKPHADATNRVDMDDLVSLLFRSEVENGDVFLLPLMLDDPWRPYSLALEVIEADRVMTPLDKISDKRIRSGVELGDRGQPVAYWIKKSHPGDLTLGHHKSNDFERIPARDDYGRPRVIHLYRHVRAGQTRGVPWFAPAMSYFKDMAEYIEAELIGKRLSACIGLVIQMAAGADLRMNPTAKQETDADGNKLDTMYPGMVHHLQPGEEVKELKPERPGDNFGTFTEFILRSAGVALGLSYELLAKNFSKTNYSSARASLLEARRYFKVWQAHLRKRVLQPVWEMLLQEAFLRGEFDVPDFFDSRKTHLYAKARWLCPGWGWVDPTKEVAAAMDSVATNLSTLAEECAGRGMDWEETLEQRKKEKDKMVALGLTMEKISSGRGGRPAEKDTDEEDEKSEDDE